MQDNNKKFILVTGGIISGLGKGTIASSLGVLFKQDKQSNSSVCMIKIDPYLNIDAGTMSPFEHGEVYVLDDGGEVDLDLGNYERFVDITLSKSNNITTGKVYSNVINKERKGDYLGKTVQIVPHITDEIISLITNNNSPLTIIELGGTVGDIESMPFVEALRQLRLKMNAENFFHIHVSLLVNISNELKSKPTQHSIRTLMSLGMQPDMLICRITKFSNSVDNNLVNTDLINKLSLFCNLPKNKIVFAPNAEHLYDVPAMLYKQHVPAIIKKQLQIEEDPKNDYAYFNEWLKMAAKMKEPKKYTATIYIIGKYNNSTDAYHSIIKALQHAALAENSELNIKWIDADSFKCDKFKFGPLEKFGLLIPGGFGNRGIEGKINAAKYARENKIPLLGICLGLQVMVIEAHRNLLDIKNANSEEFVNTFSSDDERAVIYMPDYSNEKMGGTMRLGLHDTEIINKKSKIAKLYKSSVISERHRHRYEVNPDSWDALEYVGIQIIGIDDNRCEIIEAKDHPYYVGVQFHPEFKSRPLRPSPPFVGLIKATKYII